MEWIGNLDFLRLRYNFINRFKIHLPRYLRQGDEYEKPGKLFISFFTRMTDLM